MILHSFNSYLHKSKISFLSSAFLLTAVLLFSSCSSSGRFTSREEVKIEESGTAIRVLLNESEAAYTYVVKNQLTIRDDTKKIALVKAGNSLQFIPDGLSTRLSISDKIFKADYFLIENEDNSAVTRFNGNSYTGIIKVLSSGNKISVINTLSLEDYLKGVLPLEMPVGKGEAYFESFKAFAVCARTYAVNRLKEGKSLFDIYSDTRDQVYGGSGKGNQLSDRAVDETRGIILTYENKPAVIYYHSTCGGVTENAKNIFTKEDIPYLRGIKDGTAAYCVESPRYTWQESFDAPDFVERLYLAKLIPNKGFELKKIYIKSRFESGRVNELQVLLNDRKNTPKMVSLYGNGIRSIIRTADNSTILRSTAFDITLEGKKVFITGKGFGHGVGLCQWGAMHLSVDGKSYEEILSHYYPGTRLASSDD